MRVVYLIHFDTPLAHARHYMGCTKSLARRLKEHGTSYGPRLMEVIAEAGITWRLARVWRGGWDLERQFKARHNGPRFCPLCNPKLAHLRQGEEEWRDTRRLSRS